jgi:hypothetical protein
MLKQMIQKTTNVNPIIQIWLKIKKIPILVHKLSEYMKVVEIAME